MDEKDFSFRKKEFSEMDEEDFSSPNRFKEESHKINIFKDIKKNLIKDNIKKQKHDGDKKENGKEEEKDQEGKEGGSEATKEGGLGGDPEDEKFLEEDTGSVASSTNDILKHLRMLRNALYENY